VSITDVAVRHARNEARQLLGAGLDARVLEPSPPAVHAEPFWADDPVAVGDADGPVVVPAGLPGDRDWGGWAAEHAEHRDWVAARWLGGPRRLPPPPSSLASTRQGLHRLAAYVVAPTRHAATGRFGLRWTRGGFGTPFFDDDRQVRVDGIDLVDQRGDVARSMPITSLSAAAAFLAADIDPDTAAEHDTPPVGDPDADLGLEEAAARFLGGWFGMAFAALEVLRADPASEAASRPQLWPGHFDPAVEVGDDDHRASYGASPGDGTTDEPYLYVSAWWPERTGLDFDDPYWNAAAFPGRTLGLRSFPADSDPVLIATRFWVETRDRLR
jgi:hypothetical protein